MVCLDDKNVFKSCLEASRFYSVDIHQIYNCCNRKEGNFSVQGRHFLWNDLYQKMSNKEVESFLSDLKAKNWKRILCVTTNKVFDNATFAARFYGMKRGNDKILKVCKGERHTAGKDPLTGQPLVWKYYTSLDDTRVV